MNGSLPDSYVEYDSSLIDSCLIDFTGCNGTIAFWAHIPEESVAFLSTIKTLSVNSGFSFSWDKNSGIILYSFGASTFHMIVGGQDVVPFEWYHIAFAFEHNERGTPVALYINSVHSLQAHSLVLGGPYASETFMATGFGPSGVTGFGIIDELLVFPEYLTGPQIRQ